jgi:general secretion pathway protein N
MKRYVLTGILVFIGVLVVTFPARVAFNWFAPPDIHLSGITGSVWNGAAVEGLAAGAYIQDIQWRLKPASVFSGQMAFSTSSKPASGTLTADVAVSLNGTLTLSDVAGRVPLDLIHPALAQNRISGDVSLNFETVSMRNGLLDEINGIVTVANFFVPELSSAPVGDFTATVLKSESGITATIDDLSGVFDVSATLTLSPENNYQVLGEVAARPDAPPFINQQLQLLGSPDSRGFRPFRFEGSL